MSTRNKSFVEETRPTSVFIGRSYANRNQPSTLVKLNKCTDRFQNACTQTQLLVPETNVREIGFLGVSRHSHIHKSIIINNYLWPIPVCITTSFIIIISVIIQPLLKVILLPVKPFENVLCSFRIHIMVQSSLNYTT